ncbi:DUF1501 domain-containing protein [Lignipirellula cremea]|uniref:DUF1501 domain-containing protein n=1 Tax=Lignipirellula cremea TaxID=2528010 RepID=UPI001E44F88C|nr:DUF1501 domain-containing protein [Lignipirellula cremea]
MDLARRQFFTSTASGAGFLALASLLRDDGLIAAEPSAEESIINPLAPKMPHFAPKAKRCIFIFLAGAPSHVDLYDPKPVLNERSGEPLPDSLTEKVRFAFIKKESAVLLGSPRKFSKHGESGMEVSDLLPHIGGCADDIALVRSMHTDAFNHHPAQLMMTTGVPRFGRPSLGSWLTYGLGSPSKDLPGYVVLTAGRGSSGGVSNWTSGFLPSTYQGVLFRSEGEPVLNLNNPPGVSQASQQLGLDLISRLNQERLQQLGDDEIASRTSAYHLAYRMQSAAPELIDISDETQETLDLYGVNRKEPDKYNFRGGGAHVYQQFSTNCLLARRLVERGVRVVTLMHASWDHHSNLTPEIEYNAGMLDQPAAALVQDLKRRGLLDDTLVVCAGEFGRTPLGENRSSAKNNTGRDHHPYAFSLWMAGGGIRGGQTLGETDDIGWSPVADPIHINDLHATMLHLFGFDHFKLNVRFKGLNVRLTDQGGKVVKKLLA